MFFQITFVPQLHIPSQELKHLCKFCLSDFIFCAQRRNEFSRTIFSTPTPYFFHETAVRCAANGPSVCQMERAFLSDPSAPPPPPILLLPPPLVRSSSSEDCSFVDDSGGEGASLFPTLLPPLSLSFDVESPPPLSLLPSISRRCALGRRGEGVPLLQQSWRERAGKGPLPPLCSGRHEPCVLLHSLLRGLGGLPRHRTNHSSVLPRHRREIDTVQSKQAVRALHSTQNPHAITTLLPLLSAASAEFCTCQKSVAGCIRNLSLCCSTGQMHLKRDISTLWV